MIKVGDWRVIEEAIGSLEGIINAKVVGEEEIREIHVLSKPSKSPKLLARDIETLLQARFNLVVDHKKISIVAFDVEEEKKESGLRPVLWGLSWKKNPQTFQVEVEIKLADKLYRGMATGGAFISRNCYSLVVQATLQCLNQRMGNVVFAPRGVLIQRLGDLEVALSFVDCNIPQREETLVGATLVKEDTYQAVARATLDAVNRKLIFYIPQEGEEGGSSLANK
ncbi:MAG: hypothetical protein PWP57_1108 [Candidatus Atribacteria bacterium]|nr:hypothetical protein [Candidatus Atribacteria bacterium]